MGVLSKMDITERVDRASRATVLVYVGPRIAWTNTLEGQPEGVFFVVSQKDLPLPERLAPLATEAGIVLDDHEDASRVRALAARALIAEALVTAPELLSELTSEAVRWLPSDRMNLERRHQEAIYALEDQIRLFERDLRRRARGRTSGTPALLRPFDAAPEAAIVDQKYGDDWQRERHEARAASAATLTRAHEAILQAREAELPQRMPGGARRQLGRLEAGVYVHRDGGLTKHDGLSAALQTVGGAGESVIIDWDGEWPVVVRRYDGGRVVYRVENALKRAGEDAAA